MRKITQFFRKNLNLYFSNNAASSKCYWSYYPHRLRDSVSSVCGILKNWERKKKKKEKVKMIIFVGVWINGTTTIGFFHTNTENYTITHGSQSQEF